MQGRMIEVQVSAGSDAMVANIAAMRGAGAGMVVPAVAVVPRAAQGPAPVACIRASATVVIAGTPTARQSLTAEQEQLMVEHLPIVRHVARAIHDRLPQHIELEELVGAGTLGLVDAARKFNRDKNVQFRSYAQFRVRGAILDSLRSLDWSPRELRRKGRAMGEATSSLQAQFGRAPLDVEVAAAMGLSLLQLQQLAGQLKGLEIASLQADRGNDTGDDALALVPAKESENPLAQFLEGEARGRLARALQGLPARERQVMTLYYFEEKTMREIGLAIGVVESRISQIHHVALKHLRVGLSAGSRAVRGRMVQGLPVRQTLPASPRARLAS